jgi:FkbM family methyltransferase
MLIQFSEIVKFNIPIRGVIHVGAHYGQEFADYQKAGITNLMFFEPVKSIFEKLKENIPESQRVKLYNIALGNQTGEKDMYIETANAGMSSSCLEPGTHLQSYPRITFDKKETVKIEKLDNIYFDRSQFNMINIDVQGFELEVLKGAKDTLEFVNIVYTEVNFEEVYKDCCRIDDIDNYLNMYRFKRILTKPTTKGWGDALYLKV